MNYDDVLMDLNWAEGTLLDPFHHDLLPDGMLENHNPLTDKGKMANFP